jgi:glycosyltransferase involved in cell wall biosynthesis/SAM-dependent methyltransferase
MRMRVSLCLIVRNEAANLQVCLGSAADLVDEMIVVDTGSTDNTREVAEKLGARVYPFSWVDDFAAARNESLRHATGDWVFWLDGDEHLDADNRTRLRALFDELRDENVAYLMKQRSPPDPQSGDAVVFDQCRLFRNRADVRWQYRVHEQIQPAVERAGGKVVPTNISIEHTGYQDAALYRRKAERNLRLLLLDDDERPGDPFTLFNLGWTYKHLGQAATALAYLRRSLQRCPPGVSFERKIYALLARGHYEQGQRREAIAACRKGRERYADDVELLFLEAAALSDLGEPAAAEACLVRLLANPAPEGCAISADAGMRGYKARHNLARVYRAQRRDAEAETQWRAALSERPDCVQALCELGEMVAAQGRIPEAEAIVQQLNSLGPLGALAAALVRAHIHQAQGKIDAACRVLQGAIAAGPPALEPRWLLSQLLCHQGKDRPAAEQALRAVLALDPGHSGARRMLIALRGNDNQAASASRPMRVSLCMIVRNEAANLPACLGSVAGLVDEMVLVDTGSTDGTRETARHLGARVVDFTWVDDFAAARNESMRHATGDWIFWLDGDERLDEENRRRFRELRASLKDENASYIMKQRSVTDPASGEAGVFEHARLFRNRPDIRWCYRVHEQILPALERTGSVQRFTDLVIEHAGYEEPTLYRQKQERNLRLLERQNAEQPDDSLTLYNLGLTCQVLGRTHEALAYWRRSLQLARPTFSWVRKLYAFLAGCHRELGQQDEALKLCRTGLTHFADDTELLFLEASLLSARGDLAGAESRLLHLLETPAQRYFAAGVDVGLRGFKARHNLALIYRAQQRHAEAEAQWRAVLAERPGYMPAATALGDFLLALRRWKDLEGLLVQMEKYASGKVPAALLRAARYTTTNELNAARRVLEEVLQVVPRSPELLLQLSRVLLRQGRDRAAAEQALRDLLALNPYHTEARNNLTVLLQQQGRPGEPIPVAIADELLQRAEKLFAAGRHADAAVLYRPLLHAGYKPGLMIYRLAMVAHGQEDLATAWNLHRQALAMDPALAVHITPPECPHHGRRCDRPYDIEEVANCPVCGGSSQQAIRVVNCLTARHLPAALYPIRRWVHCPACQHVFANPRPTAAALRDARKEPALQQPLWTNDHLGAWSDVAHDLWQLLPGGDFLVVGSGEGTLAAAARDQGYRASLLDLQPVNENLMRRLGIDLLQGDLKSHNYCDRLFDVIALVDCIASYAEPRIPLERVASLLRPGGAVWLSTPNYQSAWSQIHADQDPLWTDAEQLHYFCMESLRRLLEGTGLKVDSHRTSRNRAGRVEILLRNA